MVCCMHPTVELSASSASQILVSNQDIGFQDCEHLLTHCRLYQLPRICFFQYPLPAVNTKSSINERYH